MSGLLKMRKMNNPVMYVLEYLIMICVIVASNSIWVQADVGMIDIIRLRLLTFALIAVWVLSGKRITAISAVDLFPMVLAAGCMLLYSVIHYRWLSDAYIGSFFPMLAFALMAVLARNQGRLTNIIAKFVNVMAALAVESLIFFVLVNFLHVLHPTGYVHMEWSWIERVPSYYNIYYNPMPLGLQGYTLPRNCAIFPEGPMFCYPLCIALLFNEFMLPRKSKVKRIILLVAILSTLSTTGYLLLTMVIVYQFIAAGRRGSQLSKLMLVPLILLAGVAVVINILEGKLGTGSYSVRSDHVIASFKCFFATKGLGCGIGNSDYLKRFMRYKQGAACGIPIMFAQGGIFWPAAYLIPMITSGVKMLKRRQYDRLFCCVALSYLLFVTACHGKNVTWFAYGVTVFPVSQERRRVPSRLLTGL